MMKTTRNDRYVVCIRADDLLDLEVGKLYLVNAPEAGDSGSELRIVDESGEDYLYPSDWFADVELPEASAEALRAARRSHSSAAG